MIKICTECGNDKFLSEYYLDSKGKSTGGKCKDCLRVKGRARAKKYYANNKDRASIKSKQRQERIMADPILKETTAIKRRAYMKKCRTSPKWRAKRNVYKKRMMLNGRRRLNKAISGGIAKCLKNGKEGYRWSELAGYNTQDLIEHLEVQFKDGMTWDNYGKWHIDHIMPIASFDFNTPHDVEFKRCWALDNLQPLWARDNIIKSDKILGILEPCLKL